MRTNGARGTCTLLFQGLLICQALLVLAQCLLIAQLVCPRLHRHAKYKDSSQSQLAGIYLV